MALQGDVIHKCADCGHENEASNSRCSGCGVDCVVHESPTDIYIPPAELLASSPPTQSLPNSHPGTISHRPQSVASTTDDIGVVVPSYGELLDDDDYDEDDDEEETALILPGLRAGAQLSEAPFSPFQTEDLPSSPMRGLVVPKRVSDDAPSDEEELSLDDILEGDGEVLDVLDVIDESAARDSQSFLNALRKDPLIGTQLGRYRIIKKIGSGGFGTVYEAEQDLLERSVAIKILQVNNHEAVTTERFFREARALGRLRHKHIVQIVDFGELEGEALYLVMELLDGPTLREYLRDQEPFAIPRIKRLIDQLCQALGYIHDLHTYHRDLKPGNILLVEHQGYGEQAKLIDFGVASMAEEENALTRTGACLGSPSYMSPEQAKGETRDVDGRSDLYSLGILLYQMLTGKLPFYASNFAAMLGKHLFTPPPPLAESRPGRRWAPALEEFLQHALAKEQSDRPADAAAFWRLCEVGLNAQLALDADPEVAELEQPSDALALPPPPMVGLSSLEATPNTAGLTPKATQLNAGLSTSLPTNLIPDSISDLETNQLPREGSPFSGSLFDSLDAVVDEFPNVDSVDEVELTIPQPRLSRDVLPNPAEASPFGEEAPMAPLPLVPPPQPEDLNATALDISAHWGEEALRKIAEAEDPDEVGGHAAPKRGLLWAGVVLLVLGVVAWVVFGSFETDPPKKPVLTTWATAKKPPPRRRPGSDLPIVAPLPFPTSVRDGSVPTEPVPPDQGAVTKGWVLQLRSVPPGAVVWEGRTRLGRTPLRWQWPPQTRLQLSLRKPGFQTQGLGLKLQQPLMEKTIRLQRSQAKSRQIRRRPPPPRDLYGIGDPI